MSIRIFSHFISALLFVLGLSTYVSGQNVQWTVQNRINPKMGLFDSALIMPKVPFDYAPFNNKDSVARIWYNTATNKFTGHFFGNVKKPFATEDSTQRTLEDVLRAGNTTTRNLFLSDTNKIRWDKFGDYAAIQYYSTADLNNSSNLIFTMGDNSYYPSGQLQVEGFLFRKDTAGTTGITPKYDSILHITDPFVKFNKKDNLASPLFYLDRLTNRIGVNTNVPGSTFEMRSGNFAVLGGSINLASGGTSLASGGAAAIAVMASGDNTTPGYSELQGLYAGVNFNNPIVLQRQGGSVAIGNNTSPTERLVVVGNMIAAAPTYSTGGYTYLVRNATSGRFESISTSTATPTLDQVLVAGSTSTQNITSVQSITTTGTSNFNSNIVVGGIGTFGGSIHIGGATVPASILQVDGSVQFGTRTITTSQTLNTSDCNVFCNNTSAITVTLPSAAGIAGRYYVIYKINAATANVTISPAGGSGQLINGAASATITSVNSSFEVKSDGTNWYLR